MYVYIAVCERFQNHNSQFRDRITYSIYAISVFIRVQLFSTQTSAISKVDFRTKSARLASREKYNTFFDFMF